jgi:hypothetical protein
VSNDALMACRALEITGRSATAWKAVCYTLADYTNARTGRCDPSLDAIARGAGVSRGSITRILAAMQRAQLIALDRAALSRGGRGYRNRYVLLFVERWVKQGRPKVWKTSVPTAGFQDRNGRPQPDKRASPSAKTGVPSAKTGVGDAPNLESYESMNPRARQPEEARAELLRDVADVAARKRVAPPTERKRVTK